MRTLKNTLLAALTFAGLTFFGPPIQESELNEVSLILWVTFIAVLMQAIADLVRSETE